MQKESKIIAVLAAAVFCFSIMSPAYAALYGYNQNNFAPTWTTKNNPVLFDTNKDGIVDTLYTHSGLSSTSTTLTKQFGTGSQTLNIQNVASGNGANVLLQPLKGTTLAFGGSGSGQCAGSGASTGGGTNGVIDIISGTRTTFNTYTSGGGSSGDTTWLSATAYPPALYNGTKYLNYGGYRTGCGSGAGSAGTLKANTTTIQTTTNDNGWVLVGDSAVAQSRLYTEYNKFSKYYTAPVSSTTNAGFFYNSTVDNLIKQQTNAAHSWTYPQTVFAVSTTSGLLRQPNISNYNNAINPTWNTYFTNMTASITDSERLYFLNHKILKSDTGDFNRIKIKIAGVDYIGLVSDTVLYYAPTANLLDNRAVQLYLLDSYTPVIGSTSLTTSLPSQSIRITTPSTQFDQAQTGITGLVSGYKLSSQTTTDRQYFPQYTDTSGIIPTSIPPTTELTAVSVQVKNLPSDYIVKIENPTYSFNGALYQWANKAFTADDMFNVDLPTNHCFNSYVADGSLQTKVWNSLGQLCASGTMPKSVVFSQSLAFTFWSLPWGASSTYDQTTKNVQTIVRHETKPFTYYVNIYDVNGTVKTSVKYTESTELLDLHTFNTTNIGKPAKLEILDDNNSTLYFTTLGYPSSFSSVSSFFAQYFVVSGFNLLAMLPLVFAAMFTRNTVSIGTVLTVIMIATMGWLGLIAIPETLLYLMVFVAVVGMVAYKVLF